jgi:hypothetical protein
MINRPLESRPWRRLHASTYVVLLLTAALHFVLNVPGQYKPYVAMPLDDDRLIGDSRMVHERLEHGWPFTYLIRDNKFFVDRPGEAHIRPTAVWSFVEDFVSFYPWRLLADIAASVCLLGVVALSAEYWRRQRRAIWQLRVTDLLGLTTVVAAAIWYGGKTLRDYEAEVNAMRQLGLHVDEDGQPISQYVDFSVRSSGGPSWLRAAIGDERFPRVFDRLVYAETPEFDLEQLSIFQHLKAVSLAEKPGPRLASIAQLDRLEAIGMSVFTFYWPDAQRYELDQDLARTLPALAQMPRLSFFAAEGDGVGDRSAAVIAGFPRLRILNLHRSVITDRGLAALVECQTLEELYLGETEISDSALGELAKLPNLQVLDLWRCRLTDAAVEHLSKLANLQRLNLDSTEIKGDNLHKLAELQHLEFLALPETVELKAVHDLQRRMPTLKIEVGGEPFVANEPTDEE